MVEKKIYYPVRDLDLIYEKLKNISREIGAYEIDDSSRHLEITKAPSLISWGENVEIAVKEHGDGAVVIINAKRAMPVNITSQPQKIVEFVKKRLDDEFGEGKYIE